MSSKPISEYDAKNLLYSFFNLPNIIEKSPLCQMKSSEVENFGEFVKENEWLNNSKLVVKPDQLIKRRGKLGLIGLEMTFNSAIDWIKKKSRNIISIGATMGRLENFLIEPFYSHPSKDEMYVSISSNRDGEEILFHRNGGVDIGDVNSKANKLQIYAGDVADFIAIRETLLADFKGHPHLGLLIDFISSLHELFTKLHYTFIEINPFIISPSNKIKILDMAAKLDEAAHYQCNEFWGDINFPTPFGKINSPEEKYIADLDSKTGASLKLTLLNPDGRIWTLVAGGGASVIFTDSIIELCESPSLLGNYGEYSGAPSESLTYKYAQTIISLMLRSKFKGDEPKILLIGGGIANFTNVAETFNGIAKALAEKRDEIAQQNIKIYVRRGGPNYQQGLERMQNLGNQLNVHLEVYGPETNLTSIVSYALDIQSKSKPPRKEKIKSVPSFGHLTISPSQPSLNISPSPDAANYEKSQAEYLAKDISLFSKETFAIVYGMQPRAVQNMLDFDYMSRRKNPSVCCIVYPFSTGLHFRQFYWSSKEILLPVYNDLKKALKAFPQVSNVINFASSRSTLESTREMMQFPEIRVISIIAEGVPERHTKMILREAMENDKIVIGPATVGGIKPGSFRIGNSGGKIDNILSSKLYFPGSVGYVSRSGGLSNELNNIISQNCDGVYEGIAIGGDRYPITTFIDVLSRFESSPHCKMMVMLGEVGGTLEYQVVNALKSGKLRKPLVAYCTGSSAESFPYNVQFGHAGASAEKGRETATRKNQALREAGAFVPENFEDFERLIKETFSTHFARNGLDIKKRQNEIPPPVIPIDFSWASQLGLIRKPSSFMSSIVDDRKEELTYFGTPISKVFDENMGIGGVIGLLWFQRKLPFYACKFIEMVLQITADHGPAVSGAHNTIVTARAGKDLISSLVSGLLTIGPRFGGALDGAAQIFTWAIDQKLSPVDFVKTMRKRRELIMGIGHKVKSLENPDKRVKIIVDFCKANFSSNTVLEYALQVENVTTKKKSNLILNVDGAIGVCFVDLLQSCGMFSKEEVQNYIKTGAMNGLFVLGRSIGFIGHYLDQKRLKQGLYRHPVEDIAYVDADIVFN